MASSLRVVAYNFLSGGSPTRAGHWSRIRSRLAADVVLAQETARAQLAAHETLGRVAIALDRGPAPLRWLLGLRPGREAASEILGDAAAAAQLDGEMAVVATLLRSA